MTCQHTVDVAAYVLDALEPAESQGLREHLLGCAECRAAYDELRDLPDELRRLSPADAEEIVSPAELPDALCDELLARAAARRNRRSRRRVLGVAAAAAAVVAGAVTGVALPRQQPTSVTVAAYDQQTWVRASATLTSQTWGTEIRLRLTGVQWAQQCMLVVSAVDGRRDVAASWVANYKGAFDVTGTTAIPVAQIHGLDVITTAGKRLISLPPPGSTERH